MATATLSRSNAEMFARGRRYDHYFFSGMAVLILATVFVGFARTYYLAGVFLAPLPSVIIHIHGALFSSWVLLLVAQVSLVSAGRVDIHRRLGVIGFVMACLMVVMGVAAATNSLSRGFAPARSGLDPLTFYAVPMGDMLIFAVLIFFAFRARRDSPAHKRLILMATITLIVAATARPPLAAVTGTPLLNNIFCVVFALMIAGYDLWSTRRIHRATLWAGAFMIIGQQLRVPIGMTGPWHAFAGWVQAMVR